MGTPAAGHGECIQCDGSSSLTTFIAVMVFVFPSFFFFHKLANVHYIHTKLRFLTATLSIGMLSTTLLTINVISLAELG